MTLRVKILAGQKSRKKGELKYGLLEPSTSPYAASRAQLTEEMQHEIPDDVKPFQTMFVPRGQGRIEAIVQITKAHLSLLEI